VLAHANDDDLARAHFITGQSYYSQNRYQEALNEFKEAYRLSHRPRFLYNIGVCYEHLGQADDAIANYEQYLVEESEAGDRANALERIRTLKQQQREHAPAAPPPAAKAPEVPPAALTAPAAVAPAEVTGPPKPVYRRGWFWGVLVGSAAVIAGGVAAGVVLGTSSHDNTRALADLRPVP
jgi:tetratricopeptide (TPR) repeat protein